MIQIPFEHNNNVFLILDSSNEPTNKMTLLGARNHFWQEFEDLKLFFSLLLLLLSTKSYVFNDWARIA